MPRRPQSDAFETLVRILAQRSHARAELIRKLRQRSYTPEEIDVALTRAKELGLLESETDIAERYAKELAQKKRATPRWVHLKLKSRGLPESAIRNAVRLAFEGWDAHAAAWEAAQGDDNTTRVAQRLHRWGFDADIVRSTIESLSKRHPNPG